MKFIDKYSLKGINSHLIWIYEGNGRTAGINRNNDVFGDKYCCFEDNGIGEGCETIWYPDLKTARKVLNKYLSGEIPKVPVNIC